MKKKNQKGFSIIAFILIVLILLIAGFIIYMTLENSKNTLDYENYYRENIANIENDAKGYYYNQLSEPSKIMYATILSNIDALKDGNGEIEFPSNLSDSVKESGNENYNYFQSAWDAISLDNLDLFYVNTNNLSLETKKISLLNYRSYEYKLEPQGEKTYYSTSFNNRTEVDLALKRIELVVDEIVANANGSTYDKVKYAHDWIIDNFEYDSNIENKDNIYGAFINKKVVCEGYSEAFKYILDKLNIPCVLVYGEGVLEDGQSESHAWNYVKMPDGNWYAVDTTWDDPIYIGANRLFKFNTQKYDNFLKGSAKFEKNHISNGDVSGTGQNFEYPELSYSDYKR